MSYKLFDEARSTRLIEKERMEPQSKAATKIHRLPEAKGRFFANGQSPIFTGQTDKKQRIDEAKKTGAEKTQNGIGA